MRTLPAQGVASAAGAVAGWAFVRFGLAATVEAAAGVSAGVGVPHVTQNFQAGSRGAWQLAHFSMESRLPTAGGGQRSVAA
jgi:hypothetical protein